MSSSSQHLQVDSSAEAVPSWKQEVNERLAAHRTRHTRKTDNHPRLPLGDEYESPEQEVAPTTVAARVAARYAKAPTYSEMIAAEARAAAEAAEAAVKAAQLAQAAAEAILVGIELSEQNSSETASSNQAAQSVAEEQIACEQPRATARPGIPYGHAPAEAWAAPRHQNPLRPIMDPFESAMVTPPQPLAANLIEFPRELIAARKARPRFAEGPLREDASADPERSQLRIFEVETESISSEAAVEAVSTEWSSIRLDAQPARPTDPHVNHSGHARPHFDLPFQTAPIEDRVMAAIVDMALVMAGFLVFVAVFVACTTHPPTGRPALVGGALVFAAFTLLYQLLFFTYSEATPGMRYAKIAFCTFNDENPTRKAMRRRIPALALSLCAVGLGCAWAFFDEDRLSWHDRLTRMYQRSYR